MRISILLTVLFLLLQNWSFAQGTRLLRQPTVSANHIAFVHGGDLWVTDKDGGLARRLTSTPAVESNPYFSPNGRSIAFTSNRSGAASVYTVSVDGGQPRRLTWYPAGTHTSGWTPDGKHVLYASSRGTAPSGYNRLWTVPASGGPSTVLPAPWAHRGSYAPDGKRIIIDRMTRWESEFQDYRGGQNTSLILMNLETLDETWLPNERTTDTHPVWFGDMVYFLSDRNGPVNVWSYNPSNGDMAQVTSFSEPDVKWLSAGPDMLTFERDGYLHTLAPGAASKQLNITVNGDFPWAEARWEFVGDRIANVALSPTGKRAVMEARGEIFSVPVEKGDARNITRSSGQADRSPLWSPDGSQIAWFSNDGDGYALMLADQDGFGEPEEIFMGVSKMAWEPAWSPDGKWIAFVDDDVRIQVLDVASKRIVTADVGGTNIERGRLGLTWSPDSRWLAYAKTAPNNFRRVMAWHIEEKEPRELTDPLADAYAPAWDRDGRHLYFIASTNVALGSGWANTSAMKARPNQAAYVINLRKDDPSPFPPESDEEEVKDESEKAEDEEEKDEEEKEEESEEDEEIVIDFENLDRRTIALPIGTGNYNATFAGPKGSVFIRGDGGLQKFTLEDRKAESFLDGVRQVAVSSDGKKLLARTGSTWRVVDTGSKPAPDAGKLDLSLRMWLDREAEWKQMFKEAWHYERDFFYDPNLHGRDWNVVRKRYEPLISFVRHRTDLSYVLDQLNGELSVGHSFVFGGDFPAQDTVRVGLLGADFEAHQGRWRISRIYTAESWNPNLTAPLDRPGMKIEEGHYLVGIDGRELTAGDDPYRLLDGTADRQTVLHINDQPTMEDAWMETVSPIRSENGLRQRAWVEDNRRYVDEHSDGKLAYIWVPNTGGNGVVSFDRYFFAQQDKPAAVIDERFNGGGLLDDYMVDLMTRKLRAAITNEVPNGAAFRLPAGILGPKVLLINERAGSGGDFFPWVFRQQQAGPLIGMRTWGGLVKSSVHYSLIDGGALTAPDNAVFDPINHKWIAENEGVAPDIEVRLNAKEMAAGRKPQLDRAIEEALRLLEEMPRQQVVPPAFPKPAKGK